MTPVHTSPNPHAAEPNRPKLLVRDFVLTVSANFFLFLTFTSFYLLPLLIRDLGGGEVEIGYVLGTGWVTAGVLMLFVGVWLDRWGAKWVLLAGSASLGAASLGFLAADSVGPWMLALRVVQGFGMATGFTAASAIVADLAPVSRRGEAYGIFLISVLLAHAVGPLIGEAVVRAGGFPAFFAVVAGEGALSVLLGAGVRAHRSLKSRARGAPLVSLAVRTGVWTILVTGFLFGGSFGAVVTFVPTYLKLRGFETVGFFFLTYSVAAVFVRTFLSGFSDRWGRRRVILPGLAGMACVGVLLALAGGTGVFLAAAVLFGASQGFLYPALGALTVDRVSAEDRGRTLGLFNGAFHLGVFAGSAGLGVVAAYSGYPSLYWVSAAAALGCIILFARFDPP